MVSSNANIDFFQQGTLKLGLGPRGDNNFCVTRGRLETREEQEATFTVIQLMLIAQRQCSSGDGCRGDS
jgi:hypothetical protein